MGQDVWEGTESDRHGEGAADLAHGEGWHKKRAFSYETVLYGGVALLREQPVAFLLWTLFFVGVSFAVGCFMSPINVGVQVLTGSMGLDTSVEFAVNQVVTTTTSMLINVPIQQFCFAGLVGFVGHYVRTDEVDLSLLFTNVWGGVRGTLVAWALAAVSFALYLPLVAVGFGVFYATGDYQLTGIAFGASLLVLIPIGFFLLPLTPAVFAAVLDESGPFEAIVAAWQGGSGARLELFIMSLVMFVVSMSLCLMLCVPMLIAPALHMGGMSVAWLTYSRPEEDVNNWLFIKRNFS